MFERLDPTEPFRPDERFRAAVVDRGQRLRRRRHRLAGAALGTVVVVVGAVGVAGRAGRSGRWDDIQRVEVHQLPVDVDALDGDPFNVLVVGVDGPRPTRRGRARADSIMVVRIVPERRNVQVVSIPRDLWVPIAGHGEGRINSALRSVVRRCSSARSRPRSASRSTATCRSTSTASATWSTRPTVRLEVSVPGPSREHRAATSRRRVARPLDGDAGARPRPGAQRRAVARRRAVAARPDRRHRSDAPAAGLRASGPRRARRLVRLPRRGAPPRRLRRPRHDGLVLDARAARGPGRLRRRPRSDDVEPRTLPGDRGRREAARRCSCRTARRSRVIAVLRGERAEPDAGAAESPYDAADLRLLLTPARL